MRRPRGAISRLAGPRDGSAARVVILGVALSALSVPVPAWSAPDDAVSEETAAPETLPEVPKASDDPRPAVRLTVKNGFKPEDKIFPQVVEGRLLSDLADMETFRMVEFKAPGAYLLTCTIRALDLESGHQFTLSREAESDGRAKGQDLVTATMDLEIVLEGDGTTIHRGSLSVQASREFEISSEHTISLLSQELIDRAAHRIERIVRKKLRKR